MSKKLVAFVVISSLIFGGIGGWVFSRYIIPKINTISFLTKYNLVPTAGPVVINTREEVRVNEGSDSIAAIQRAKPWVVGILNNGDINSLNYRGTGVILTSDGIIATSNNAVSQTTNTPIRVAMQDGTVMPATVLAVDPATNLVFLKVNGNGLPTAEFGSSRDLKLGQRIITLSQSFNENQTVDRVSYLSSDIHSNFSKVNFSDTIAQTYQVANLDNLQEGSLIVSLDGKAQGIFGHGAVITADTVKSALNNYFTNKGIVRPTFGFYYQQVSATTANALNLPKGLLVRRSATGAAAVAAGSAAQTAGLKEGDVITEIDGNVVNDQNSFEDLTSAVKSNSSVKFKVIRAKETLQLNLVTKEEAIGLPQ